MSTKRRNDAETAVETPSAEPVSEFAIDLDEYLATSKENRYLLAGFRAYIKQKHELVPTLLRSKWDKQLEEFKNRPIKS